jgi:hypothetical protein
MSPVTLLAPDTAILTASVELKSETVPLDAPETVRPSSCGIVTEAFRVTRLKLGTPPTLIFKV